MNIFATSKSAIRCAEVLDDKRVVKMVLETSQLLATSINLCGGKATYKSTHVNHPCAIWARTSKSNYEWLLSHFDALLLEYHKRFGKVHKCDDYYNEFVSGLTLIPDGPLTDHPNCTIFKEEKTSIKLIECIWIISGRTTKSPQDGLKIPRDTQIHLSRDYNELRAKT